VERSADQAFFQYPVAMAIQEDYPAFRRRLDCTGIAIRCTATTTPIVEPVMIIGMASSAGL
jgi:hypothetical protein